MDPDLYVPRGSRQIAAAWLLYGMAGLMPPDAIRIKRGSSRDNSPKMQDHREKRKRLLKLKKKAQKINRLRKAA